MKKGQNTVEFIIVLLFFMIVTIVLITSYLKIFPSEITKVKEHTACSQAETLAIQLLEFPGNSTNWDTSGNLNELGLTTGTKREINYDKIQSAKSSGYYNITTDAKLTIPFRMSYSAYAINLTNDSVPTSLPDNYNARVFLVREPNSLIIYAGSNNATAELSMKFFFPEATVTTKDCSTGALEIGDTNTTVTKTNGDEVELIWATTQGDLDCINLTMNSPSQIVFIKRLSFINSALGKTFPVYLNNQTKLQDEFGSSGYRDKDKSFCELERVGLIIDEEAIPAKFKVISWR
jgi:hypothetical protein